MVSLARGNGVATHRTFFDVAGQHDFGLLARRRDPGVIAMDYHYDAGRQLEELSQSHAGDYSGYPQRQETLIYEYDGLERLSRARSESSGSGPLAPYDFQYSYLENGNLESVRLGGQVMHYQYSSSAHPHAVTRISGATEQSFQYDASGNMTRRTRGPQVFTQSFKLRFLTGVTTSGKSTAFAYDGTGSRIKAERDGVVTYYPFPEFERTEYPGGAWRVRKNYDGFAVRTVSSPSMPGDGLHFVHRDHLGSVRALSDSSGQVVAEMEFLPFGEKRSGLSGAEEFTEEGFTGHREEQALGLTYMNSRYYVPSARRFASADTVIPDGRNLLAFDPYAYVHNNPISNSDPSGYAPWSRLEIERLKHGRKEAKPRPRKTVGHYLGKALWFFHDTVLLPPGRLGARTTGINSGYYNVTPLQGNVWQRFGQLTWQDFTDGLSAAGLAMSFAPGAATGAARGLSNLTRGPLARLKGLLLPNAVKALPQGFTSGAFEKLSSLARAGAGHISDDIAVHGSRANHTASAGSDVDIAIRVSGDRFNQLIRQAFGTPNPGSAKERTMLHAIETGKIHAGEAGLRALRRNLAKELGMPVDISVIKIGGLFDKGPYIPLQ
jgi:RHS repeat-associated protein